MYAVFESGGLQFSAEEGSKIKVPFFQANPGDTIAIDKILLVKKGDDAYIGNPYLESASVEAEVLGEGKADKIDVYKFKRRIKYRRLRGHRQKYTELEIKKITTPEN